ncbi:tyrosine-type recombinase/integrase [Bacillus sp. AFS031507]|uniref:tyrosine-type recombinase/integrase n=1 Tax=Bacillus sp. AFS031507 TaxID=2033496 RepID=UPI000BFD27EE|nr:tyrosine-type recombinase/integrase [Bacillus sp. AFS031507]PGY10626.1 integrase [Bacillus sp. AFS031507]
MDFKRKTTRKHGRGATTKKVIEEYTLTEMFEKFMWFKNTEGLAPRTIEEYELHFRWLMDYLGKDLPADDVTLGLFLKWVKHMRDVMKLADNTVNIRIRTMRAFLRWCHKEEYIVDPIHEDFKPKSKPVQEPIETLSPVEIKTLLNNFDLSTWVGFRDKVMVMVLLDSMVRISELLAMKRSNVDLKKGIIKLEAMNTKTRKAREVLISSKTIKLLKEYMEETEETEEGFLFLTYDGREMLSNTWRTRLHEVAGQSGIKKAIRPHILRHTGAVLYIMNGGDPFSLQTILGHSDMSMTKRYVQMSNLDLKRQHNLFSPLKNV